jgi:hypothetical protein
MKILEGKHMKGLYINLHIRQDMDGTEKDNADYFSAHSTVSL